jgi:hypothetical protein
MGVAARPKPDPKNVLVRLKLVWAQARSAATTRVRETRKVLVFIDF